MQADCSIASPIQVFLVDHTSAMREQVGAVEHAMQEGLVRSRQSFKKVKAKPVLSKNPIDAIRRADSTLDARRVATFVTAESLC